jgi:glucokinase
MQILAGDIGGSNTRLALYQAQPHQRLSIQREAVYPSRDYADLTGIITTFLSAPASQPVKRACLGIAGPVINQTCDATNLPWHVSASAIQARFGFNQTWLLNDLEACAWSIDGLPEEDIYPLHPGIETHGGNRSIVSAGTGLGEAGVYWDNSRYHPFPTEGGHSDFSPANLLEYELFEWLADRHGHVSWERLVSGPGLENIYHFLLSYHQTGIPDWLQRKALSQELAPAISEAALHGRDDLCLEALDLFIQLYGREAGNHALKLMARGGVYLGGGIAPRILDRLKTGGFLQAFFDKGRMRHLLEAMPVRVILNDKASLLGAARYALLH